MLTSGFQKRLTVAVLLAVALMLASCGGGEGTSDEEAIEKMVTASIYEFGPQACLKYSTRQYLETTSRLEGDAAVEDCEEAAWDIINVPEGVEVSKIDVDGSSATGVVIFEGSVVDGQKLRIGFAERGGRWKYDEWLGFEDFDGERLILQVGREGMLQADSPQEAERIACVIGGMEEMKGQSLEKELFESPEPLSELWENCGGGSSTT